MSKNDDNFNTITTIKDFKKPKNIALTGMMIALYLAIYSLNIQITPVIQIRFGFVVLALSGFIGGPIMGVTVGTLGDLLSMFLLSAKGGGAPYNPGFTLSYAVIGLICGIVFYRSKISTLRIILVCLFQAIISLFYTSYLLSVMYNTDYIGYILLRYPNVTFMFFVNIIMLYSFMKSGSLALKKALLSH